MIKTTEKTPEPMKEVAVWDGFKSKAEELMKTATTLTVTDASQVAEIKKARDIRLLLRDLRISIEKRRKELGEYHLREKQSIDADAKALKDMIEPLEDRLLIQEEFVEREEAKVQAEKKSARLAEITPFLTAPIAIDLGLISDQSYKDLLTDAKNAHEAKLQRERHEREEREASEKRERERIEAQRLENERLRKEADEREEAIKKEREAHDKEKAVLKKQAEDARLAQEKKDSDAHNKREEAKAAAALAAAPDKQKLESLARSVRITLAVPKMDTVNGMKVAHEVLEKIEAFAKWIEKKASEI